MRRANKWWKITDDIRKCAWKLVNAWIIKHFIGICSHTKQQWICYSIYNRKSADDHIFQVAYNDETEQVSECSPQQTSATRNRDQPVSEMTYMYTVSSGTLNPSIPPPPSAFCRLRHAGRTFYQTYNARRPCLSSGFCTCVEQFAVIRQECAVADEWRSIVIWRLYFFGRRSIFIRRS